jgi:hypothetical protein
VAGLRPCVPSRGYSPQPSYYRPDRL